MGYRIYGYGDWPREEDGAICPLCGCPCERAYYRLGELIGCDACVEEKDAEDRFPPGPDGRREERCRGAL